MILYLSKTTRHSLRGKHFLLLSFYILSFIFYISLPTVSFAAGEVGYVSTLVGTMSKHSLSTGNTYPAIALPWGMNFWTPQTGRMGDGWAYVYTEDKLRGIKQTHQPSPWINDYGQFAIMPTTRTVFREDDRASWFSHKAETATPYYYKVYLADWDVTAELAPTERAAIMRLTYPETSEARVVIDPFDGGSCLQIDEAGRRVMGYTTKNSGGVPEGFKNYFVIEFSHPITFAGIYGDKQGGDKLLEDIVMMADNHVIGVVGIPTLRRGEQVTLRIASSFISYEQALRNLAELGDRSFDEVCAAGRQRWDDVLGRIRVDDDDICAPSTRASTAPTSFPARSSSTTRRESPSTTVLTQVRCCPAVISPTLVSGTPSAASSRSSTSSIPR